MPIACALATHEQGIGHGEWIYLETRTGKIKLNGHDPFTEKGANPNLLIPNSDVDAISASVAHRGQCCRVTKL